MTLTQQHSVEKYRPGIVAEALRSGNMGCSAEECRCGLIIGGSQAGTGDPTAINNSSMVS